MRLQRSLAGMWQFQLDPEGIVSVESLSPDRQITVPLPWQAAFPELQPYSGYAWYRYTLDLDAEWLGGELLLKFGAVDYWSEVYVNRLRCGLHEGGHTPFTLPISRFVKQGQNEIIVRVYDSAQTGIAVRRWPDNLGSRQSTPPSFDAHSIPHGKQDWYINVGGIWQDVTLIAVPLIYIDYARIE